jgi:hypothetical protein
VQDRKPVYWCPHCETALAEAEVEYETKTSTSIFVKVPVVEWPSNEDAQKLARLHGKKVNVLIWTTTPWTLPANVGLAFHPEGRYRIWESDKTHERFLVGDPGWAVLEDMFGGGKADAPAVDGLHPWKDWSPRTPSTTTIPKGSWRSSFPPPKAPALFTSRPATGKTTTWRENPMVFRSCPPWTTEAAFRTTFAQRPGRKIRLGRQSIDHRTPGKSAAFVKGDECRPQLSPLLAMQEPHFVPRGQTVVFKSDGRVPHRAHSKHQPCGVDSRLRPRTHFGHVENPARLVLVPSTVLGHADPHVPLRLLRRTPERQNGFRQRGQSLSAPTEAMCGTKKTPPILGLVPRGRMPPAPNVATRCSKKKRTFWTSGSIPGCRGCRFSNNAPKRKAWAGPTSCIWKAPTNTGAGFKRRFSRR